ncbi:SMP-30/gluconolactonase/LRE family protein [Caballeronia sp. LZ029]|uniref:SMP-30/gluconolactonase/LRE family protein n=1 Tax=Caballeronia sp. LZ029 TaxID=3038564 RepID=UPI00285A88FA|nr:SMP-30/gluconolactonase/LRE family protein [Caballeronia sp. LZ029]MDR5746572.1 SMP-30/gluconolactonase/LRE family protein [Caballeronia sp. LZ029]
MTDRTDTIETDIVIYDLRAKGLFPVRANLERLCTGAIWGEGPVWIHEDASVLWSDIPNNRMLRWSERDGMTVWRENVEFTNGHARERDGSILHCSHGQRAIVRTRFGPHLEDAADEIVVGLFEGKRFNSPNDIIVKRDGTIWFSDPPYGIVSDREGHAAESELGDNYVFRYDPATGALTVATDFVEEPNGLAFSPDESVLYVSDTSAALRTDGGGHHHIVAFDVVHGRELVDPRIFAVIEPGLADGFRVDREGCIFTSSADSVQVFHPDGTRLARIGVPEKVANLTFGGPDGKELYICASSSLYRIRLNTRGAT